MINFSGGLEAHGRGKLGVCVCFEEPGISLKGPERVQPSPGRNPRLQFEDGEAIFI